MQTKELISYAEKASMRGEPLPRDAIVRLLEIDPDSEIADLLGEAARRVASAVTTDRARIWASIGVDFKPCTMNCRFCSFGEAWGTAIKSYTLSEGEILHYARKFIEEGADWITLRTTEDYAFSDLSALASAIKKDISWDFRLVANTGELNALRAEELKDSGFDIVYHAIRLREGSDTPFSPEDREETLDVIRKSGLDLAFLVEPVGIEHSNEEIADILLLALKHEASLSGAMARIPVAGTPLGSLPLISERRLAQVIAVIRLAAGYKIRDICVHPPSQTALRWGANVVVVDIGALPRSADVSLSEWNGFNIEKAAEWFKEAGYGRERSGHQVISGRI